jgi:hypothetical protein
VDGLPWSPRSLDLIAVDQEHGHLPARQQHDDGLAPEGVPQADVVEPAAVARGDIAGLAGVVAL